MVVFYPLLNVYFIYCSSAKAANRVVISSIIMDTVASRIFMVGVNGQHY